MNQAHSVPSTIYKGIKLFVISYVEVFPLISTLAMFQLLMDYLWKVYFPKFGEWAYVCSVTLHVIVAILFFCFIVHAVYQKHHQQRISLSIAIVHGFKRFLPLLIGLLIVLMPIVFMLLLMFASMLSFYFIGMFAIFIYEFLCVCLIYHIFISTDKFILPVMIVCKDEKPTTAKKKCEFLVFAQWLKNFSMLFFVLITVVMVGVFLSLYILPEKSIFLKEGLTLIAFSLAPCFMVVFEDYLEARQKVEIAQQSSIPAYQFKNPTPQTKRAIFFLYGFSIVSVILAIWKIYYFNIKDKGEGIDKHEIWLWIISLDVYIFFVGAAICYSLWLYTVAKNVCSFNPSNIKISPAWAVASYYIPILNIIFPLIHLSVISRVSKNPQNWKNEKHSILLPVWWVFWIVFLTMATYNFWFALQSLVMTDRLMDRLSYPTMDICMLVLQSLCALVLIAIIKSITRDQILHNNKSQE